MNLTSIFFELLQVALGKRTALSAVLSDEQWLEVCRMAHRQCLLGIAFAGLDSLPKEQCPSKRPMVKMYAESEKLRSLNAVTDKAVSEAVARFVTGGFDSVLLKGQGVARFYPDPALRTPGDIDLWVLGPRGRVADFVRTDNPKAVVCYHHIDCSNIGVVELEAHFTPSWMYSPFLNRKLQNWFRSQWQEQKKNLCPIGGKDVAVASLSFNRVYILIHIFRHLYQDGIGLRQVMDYYYVLTSGFTEKERLEALSVLKSLKLTRFTAALMYVMQKVFGMDEKFFLLSPDARDGEFLLSEILRTGNFGYFDDRRKGITYSETSSFVYHCRRMCSLFRFCPEEVLFSPFFKIYNFFIRHFL